MSEVYIEIIVRREGKPDWAYLAPFDGEDMGLNDLSEEDFETKCTELWSSFCNQEDAA